MTFKETNGAIDIQFEDGRRIWCPPAWVASMRGKPFNVTTMTITKPYWTAGPMCKYQSAGPELTENEIAELLKELPNG